MGTGLTDAAAATPLAGIFHQLDPLALLPNAGRTENQTRVAGAIFASMAIHPSRPPAAASLDDGFGGDITPPAGLPVGNNGKTPYRS